MTSVRLLAKFLKIDYLTYIYPKANAQTTRSKFFYALEVWTYLTKIHAEAIVLQLEMEAIRWQ